MVGAWLSSFYMHRQQSTSTPDIMINQSLAPVHPNHRHETTGVVGKLFISVPGS